MKKLYKFTFNTVIYGEENETAEIAEALCPEIATVLAKENTNLYGILIDIMKELSVLYPKHEIKTLPEKVKEVVQRLVEAEKERTAKAWEECAENLVDYAHEFVAHLYDRYDKDIKQAEDAIEAYNKLKNETIRNRQTLS